MVLVAVGDDQYVALTNNGKLIVCELCTILMNRKELTLDDGIICFLHNWISAYHLPHDIYNVTMRPLIFAAMNVLYHN